MEKKKKFFKSKKEMFYYLLAAMPFVIFMIWLSWSILTMPLPTKNDLAFNKCLIQGGIENRTGNIILCRNTTTNEISTTKIQ